MKAIVYRKYGTPDELKLEEVATPSPKDGDVLIRIHAATVTAGDCEVRRFDITPMFWIPVRLFMGIIRPRIRILGQELAGEVESVGKNVTRFKKGDKVFAAAEMTLGGYAEYICLPEKHTLAMMPSNMTYEEAATIPTGGLNALHFLNKASIKPGQKVLINGAGGSIGTYGIQIARSYGAKVTAVDSGEKLAMLRSVGADRVIDYTEQDFTADGELYDVIFDVIGKGSISRGMRSLKPRGVYLVANPGIVVMMQRLWASVTSRRNVITGMAAYRSEDLNTLVERIEAGTIRSVIDKRYPLEQTADAHRYVEAGHKKGNVVIAVR